MSFTEAMQVIIDGKAGRRRKRVSAKKKKAKTVPKKRAKRAVKNPMPVGFYENLMSDDD